MSPFDSRLLQLAIERFFNLIPEDNKALKCRSGPRFSKQDSKEVFEKQHSYLPVGQKILLIDAQPGAVMIEFVANAMVVLDVRFINPGQAVAGVLPKQAQEARKAVFNCLDIFARNFYSRLRSRK